MVGILATIPISMALILICNPSCHLKRLENKVKATGKDKESHFEFEPGGGDGMDMLGQ